MTRKILCTALALVLLHGMTACASAPNIQTEADKISNKILPQQSLSAPDVTGTVRDSTAAEASVGNTDYSANEPSSTTACGPKPDAHLEAEKISDTPSPQPSVSAPDVTDTVHDSTAAEAPVGNTDYSANEPSSTTARDSEPDAHRESEKISGTPSPQPSVSAPDMTSVVQDSTTKESPGGNIEYSVYEPYGLLYDSQNRCYTFNGSIVKYFNDPAVGASFTNYFTGTVDIEAEYDAKNVLIGIKECSKEVCDYHNKKQAAFSKAGRTDTAVQSGTQSPDTQWLKDYEAYGISYNAEKCSWYYGDERIKVLIDSEKKSVYQTDENGIYLSVVRNEDHIAEIKKISEAEAKYLMKENNPQDNGELTTEE